MKVYIGSNIKEGSFGGGNQFAKDLSSYLKSVDVEVTFDLTGPVDILLLTEPRPNLAISSLPVWDINSYLNKFPNTIVVHRINECDERKGTTFVNNFLVESNQVADHTVFIASWLIDLFQKSGMDTDNRSSVVLNGADDKFFFKEEKKVKKQKYKVVTHHWSHHYLKGWDIYEHFDSLLEKKEFQDKFEFHYIGNVSDRSKYKNIIFHDSLSGKELGDALRKMDIYLTGTVNEPAGMHHIEGAMCGLPLIYRSSGALPEYCHGYGVEFNDLKTFESSLNDIYENYETYVEKVNSYSRTSTDMCKGYLDCFRKLVEDREEIVSKRKINSNLYYNFSYFKYRLRRKVYSL